jgi:hypothetical protein
VIRFTAFGGAFLLFPVLDRFPLAAATRGWPDLDNVSATAIVRFLILAGCLGTTRALGAFRDPLLRDLMQIHPQVDAARVGDWLAGLSPDHLVTFVREIAEWHLETGEAGDDPSQAISAADDDGPVTVVRDSARGLWLAVEDAADPAPGPPPELSADLAYLAVPRELCTHRQCDLALRLAAHNVLRLFAARLSGFARSSLDYLHGNFLDCSAAVEDTPGQRVVRLGRPPLHLVLAMAGLSRCQYTLSWLNGPACAVFPEDGF